MAPEWFALQKRYASPGFQREQEETRSFLQNGVFEQKNLSLQDIQSLLPDNLLIALVNSRKLANQPGESGHFVVVYKKDQDTFTLHDPGLPPRKAWTVGSLDFMRAYEGDMIVVPKVPKKTQRLQRVV